MGSKKQNYSKAPPNMPGLILVQHGTAVIDGKRVKLLHIERETEDYIYQRNAQKSNGQFPPGIPGRPRKKTS